MTAYGGSPVEPWPTAVLDVRWLGMGGAGRVTDLLLRELAARPERVRWLAWDGWRVGTWPFEETPRGDEARPTALWGQRDVLARPRHAPVVYLHQIRPIAPGTSVTFMHDTIPLHFGSAAARALRRAYFAAVARVSSRVVTVSEHSARSLVRDVGIDPARIAVVTLPVDGDRARAILERRRATEGRPILLYVGRFAVHKNLARLARAFPATAFSRNGGRLVLVGGTPSEARDLRARLARGTATVEVRVQCVEDELDALMVDARAVVMPSLEEGCGLPAFEAAAAGIPVAASVTGAMTTLPRSSAVLFDPRSESAMIGAIDAAVARPRVGVPWLPSSTLAETVEALVLGLADGTASR